MHAAVDLPLLFALYAAIASVDLAFLIWKWRDVDNGLSPMAVAALWPVVLPLLGAYYVAASCYTLAAVLRGRRTSALSIERLSHDPRIAGKPLNH